MKNSNNLNVKTKLTGVEEIIIHPNSGFDLGLMNTRHKIKLFINATIEEFNTGKGNFVETELFLSNDCKSDEIILSHKFWKKIGSPPFIKLFYENGKLLLTK